MVVLNSLKTWRYFIWLQYEKHIPVSLQIVWIVIVLTVSLFLNLINPAWFGKGGRDVSAILPSRFCWVDFETFNSCWVDQGWFVTVYLFPIDLEPTRFFQMVVNADLFHLT